MATPFVVAAGDNVVDCYENRGEMYPGGNCVNVSVFVRRFGGRSAYLGRVGPDTAGRHLRAALEQEGVELDLLRTVQGNTAHCSIGHRDGDRVFLSSARGVSVFVPEPAELDAMGKADAVHVGATSELDEWIPEIARRARLSYDFTVFRSIEHIARIAPHAYLATFSGGGLSEVQALELGRRATSAGARWSLVTRGAQGAVLTDGQSTWVAPAEQTEVVDTLGAGDTFLARTLVGLLRDESPNQTLRAAAVEAAATCRTIGAFGHPSPTVVGDALLREGEHA